MGFFSGLKDTLSKTRKAFTEKIDQLVHGYATIDEEFLDDLEAVLLSADVGMTMTTRLMGEIRAAVRRKEINTPADVEPFLRGTIAAYLKADTAPLDDLPAKPYIIMVVGVNGVGKTTTIGKLARRYNQAGKKVILAAGDTFRAAAIDQLEIWGERTECEVIKQSEGSDPAAVVFDALQAAQSRKADVLIIDTAGRLHTKSNLMEELKKVHRVIRREVPDAPHETLLVLDGTTGQNAMSQAKIFSEAAGVTGVVLTKLDGTAKGGVVLSIHAELGLPVRWVGVGEGKDDLHPFDPADFAAALFPDK